MTMTTPTPSGPPDQAARETATRCFDRNLVVVAGAGSGKTTLLVERVLNACLGRGVRLSRVAALTFTEKAAAEMRDRLAAQLSNVLSGLAAAGGVASARARDAALEALTERGSPARAAWGSVAWTTSARASGGLGVDLATVRERALAALEDLDGSVVGTIHSSCGDLLRRHPSAARLDPAFAVDDGGGLERVFDAEWTAYLAEEMRGGSPREAAWRRALERIHASALRDVAWDLVRRGDVVPDVAAPAAAERMRAEAALVRERIPDAAEQATNRNMRPWLETTAELLHAFEEGGGPLLARHLESLDFDYAVKKPPSRGKDAPERVDEVAAEARRLVIALATTDDQLVGDVIDAVAPVVDRVLEQAERSGLVSFNRLLVGARDVLRDAPTVRRAEQARLDMLLIDEFQDTNPLQYEIAFLLAEAPDDGRAATNDPWAVRLEPGRLFVVGDPKQSIYRFLNADMASYERAVQRIVDEGGEQVVLSATFRSRREVVEPVNVTCGALVVGDRPYQPHYEPLVPARADADAGEPRVEVWTVRHDGRGASANRLAEARALAREIAAWDRAGTHRFADVTVLFRAMSDIALYQRALSEAGVPFVTQGGRSLAQREEVVQALTLLRCLVMPNDAVALLAVLRSPSCGASDAELLRFAELVHDRRARWTFRGAEKLPTDVAAELPNVARTLRGLESLSRRIARLPADEAVRALLADPARAVDGEPPAQGLLAAWHPRLVELNAASHGGAQRLANLEKLVSRAADLARREGLSLLRVVERLGEELGEGADLGESPLADEAIPAVKLMTIHQAKGLEFPVVVIPDVARQPGAGRSRARVRVADGLISIVLPDGTRNVASVLVDRESRRHEDAEQVRLLYVAMTRAKERLVLVNGNPSPVASAWPHRALRETWGYDAASDVTALLDGAVVHRVMDDEPGEALEVPRDALDQLAAAVAAQDDAARRFAAAVSPDWRSATGDREALEAMLARSEYRPSEGVSDADSDGEGGATDVWSDGREPLAASGVAAAVGGAFARAVGVAVHGALEHWDFERGDALLRLGASSARLAALETGQPVEPVEVETRRLLTSLAASSVPARVRGATVLARELPFLLEREDGERWQGFVDLVLEEREGRRATWVVDWKTDRDRRPEAHRAQLALYADAVRRWRGLAGAPGIALVYVANGEWVTLAEPA